MKIWTEKQQIFVNRAVGRSRLRRIEWIAVVAAAVMTVVTAARCAEENAQQPSFSLQTVEQAPAASEKLNLNTATEAELEDLPDIGPALAERIIAWREENGAFTSEEDVLDVDGIGPSIWKSIEPFVTY
jgi:DNA uptake protein and related DNA-binding proteins